MLSPMEIFDGMLERIQQFPLDAHLLEINIKRINKDHKKYKVIYDRLVAKLVSPDNKKYIKVTKKMKKCISKKVQIVEKYERKVAELLTVLKEMIALSGITVLFSPLKGHGPAIIKLGEISVGTTKYCLCNGRAQDNMICCENPKCNIKWYHFKCVNLTNSPKEKWICSKCKFPNL